MAKRKPKYCKLKKGFFQWDLQQFSDFGKLLYTRQFLDNVYLELYPWFIKSFKPSPTMKSCGSSNKEALKSSPSLDNEIKHGPTILDKDMADLDQPLSAQFSRKKGLVAFDRMQLILWYLDPTVLPFSITIIFQRCSLCSFVLFEEKWLDALTY